MTTMTYREALRDVIEVTEMGYSIRSQDRLWIVFTFDLWSEGEDRSFRYNRLYSRGIGNGWAYDLDMDGVLVFTNRKEAEEHRDRLQHWINVGSRHRGQEPPTMYVMNLGDDARYEATIIGRDNGHATRSTPKFKGSEAAWQALNEMGRRWAEENL